MEKNRTSWVGGSSASGEQLTWTRIAAGRAAKQTFCMSPTPLVYFVMVVNFQSWLDPFIILMALPGALSGILLMLFVTQTTINVPSLMGAIMSIGVATANSILLVNFANDVRASGADSITAALEAGYTRLRPVIMTALAMVVG